MRVTLGVSASGECYTRQKNDGTLTGAMLINRGIWEQPSPLPPEETALRFADAVGFPPGNSGASTFWAALQIKIRLKLQLQRTQMTNDAWVTHNRND